MISETLLELAALFSHPPAGPMSCDQRSCPSSCCCPSCRMLGPSSRQMKCLSMLSNSTCVWPCPRMVSPLCLRSSSSRCPFSSLYFPTSRRTSRCKSRYFSLSFSFLPSLFWFRHCLQGIHDKLAKYITPSHCQPSVFPRKLTVFSGKHRELTSQVGILRESVHRNINCNTLITA